MGLGWKKGAPTSELHSTGISLSDLYLKPAPPLDRLLEERQPYVLEGSSQKWIVCLAELGDGKEGMFLVQIMQTLEFGLSIFVKEQFREIGREGHKLYMCQAFMYLYSSHK